MIYRNKHNYLHSIVFEPSVNTCLWPKVVIRINSVKEFYFNKCICTFAFKWNARISIFSCLSIDLSISIIVIDFAEWMRIIAAPFEDARLALRCHCSVKDCKLIVCNGNVSPRLFLIKADANDPIPNATYLYRGIFFL